jgi:hypothetical protein
VRVIGDIFWVARRAAAATHDNFIKVRISGLPVYTVRLDKVPSTAL